MAFRGNLVVTIGNVGILFEFSVHFVGHDGSQTFLSLSLNIGVDFAT